MIGIAGGEEVPGVATKWELKAGTGGKTKKEVGMIGGEPETIQREPQLMTELFQCSSLLNDVEGRVNELRTVLNYPRPNPAPMETAKTPQGSAHKVEERIQVVQSLNCRLDFLNGDLLRIIEVVREV